MPCIAIQRHTSYMTKGVPLEIKSIRHIKYETAPIHKNAQGAMQAAPMNIQKIYNANLNV